MEDKSIDIDEQAKKITKLMASRLAEKIKTVRREKNITTRKLKELANVSTAIISDFETKSNYLPKMDVLVKFAIALDIDIKDMFSTMLPPNEMFDLYKYDSELKLEDMIRVKFKHLNGSDIEEIIKFAKLRNYMNYVDSVKDKFKGCTISTDENNNTVFIKNGNVIFNTKDLDISTL